MRARAMTRVGWRTAAVAMAVTGLVVTSGPGPLASAAPAAAERPAGGDRAGGKQLTNLSHLDFLLDRVAPPAQDRHTTYRLSDEPDVSLPWTYAEHEDDGAYRRVGGGAYDADTDTYGQGAFNADDISRAAVVYLRHFRSTGHAQPRRRLRPAARPHLPPDVLRPRRGQRRAVDAARRHAQPERRTPRGARPLGLRPLLLAGPDPVGAG